MIKRSCRGGIEWPKMVHLPLNRSGREVFSAHTLLGIDFCGRAKKKKIRYTGLSPGCETRGEDKSEKKKNRERQERFRTFTENVRRLAGGAVVRHYQRRPRSSSRSGALDQSNGNRGMVQRVSLLSVHRTGARARARAGGGESRDFESRDSSPDRETQSKSSRAPAFPANIRAEMVPRR